jgi:hypothetical protein
MTLQYQFYLNHLYFDSLYEYAYYSDRPEFYRSLEKPLWIMYQLLQTNQHTLVICDAQKTKIKTCTNEVDFKAWVAQTYPGLQDQLSASVYTRYPHPADRWIETS